MDIVKTLNGLIEDVDNGDVDTLAELQRELIHLRSELEQLNLYDVGSSFVEYEKKVSINAITLKDITEDNIVVGRYVLDEGKLYKIDLVEKHTLIDLK
ncbi:hypothetical protein [Polaribacter sp.]|uniref:hypothetical protein n=1 Tax=Polaribacter sp. TaxID=1920175 RepID=UPI003F6CA5C4